jgi:predicted AAA+ superfamily ATPase
MISRTINLKYVTNQNYSVFLFGPRGVGKTSLINELDDLSLRFDLLNSETFRSLKLDPTILRYQVESVLESGSSILVAIDEVQLIPELLNEVHSLIESHRNRVNFILTGSSARKLKREEANMLGGRAVQMFMHPLSILEIPIDIQKALTIGTLPRPYLEKNDPNLFLSGYVDTYLREEIKQESLVRKLDSFIRFLDLAAQLNGENINFSKLGRQCGVASSTIGQYYSILEDTLIVHRINGWSESVKKQMVIGPRYYFFDCGVLNSLRRELQTPLEKSSFRYGKLFESYIICELFRIFSYKRADVRFNYWRTNTGMEVDLIITRSVHDRPLAIEIKSGSSPDATELKGLYSFLEDNPKSKLICICQTEKKYTKNQIEFVPWQNMLEIIDMLS